MLMESHPGMCGWSAGGASASVLAEGIACHDPAVMLAVVIYAYRVYMRTTHKEIMAYRAAGRKRFAEQMAAWQRSFFCHRCGHVFEVGQ